MSRQRAEGGTGCIGKKRLASSAPPGADAPLRPACACCRLFLFSLLLRFAAPRSDGLSLTGMSAIAACPSAT